MMAAPLGEVNCTGMDAYCLSRQELHGLVEAALDGASSPSSERIDSYLRDVLKAKLPLALRYVANKAELEQLLRLFAELAALDHHDCLAVATNLIYLLDRLSVGGLRRWIVTGLRCYPEQADARSRYFKLEDAFAVRSLAFEEAGNVFERFRPSLQFYVDGFIGQHIKLESKRSGILNCPPTRTVITEQVVFLPEGFSVLDGAKHDEIYRAAVAHAIAHMNYSPKGLDIGTLKPMSIAIISLVEDARVEYLMAREYPGLHRLWGKFLAAEIEASNLTFRAMTMRLAKGLHDPEYCDDNHWVNKGVALFKERLAEPENYAAFREVGSILANDLGQMRVRFNPRQYVPEPAYRDDNSILWDYSDPDQSLPPEESLLLQGFEVELQEREDDSPPRADQGRPEETIVLETEEHTSYPEWDYKTERERDDWVTVISKPIRSGPRRKLDVVIPHHRGHHNIFSLIKANQLNRAAKHVRQWEGDQLDLNAAVSAQVSLRSGLVPDPRIFVRPGRRSPKPSVLILLDLSESTNDRVFGRFDTILDMAKTATVVLGEAITEAAERFAVHGFSSNGRHEVEYYRVKDFAEPFGHAQSQRILGLQSGHSTRIGAAMRHAGALVAAEDTERKVILVVTDGEPSDVDVFDPEYLIEDAAYVTRELRGVGVTSFCLSLDMKAEEYVSRIFGRNFLIVDDILELPLQLSRVFVRLLNC